MSNNRRFSSLVQQSYDNHQYQSSLPLQHSQHQRDWGNNIHTHLTKSSQNNPSESLGSRSEIERVASSDGIGIVSHHHDLPPNYQENTNSPISPPPTNFPSPQIAALAAAAAYHPLWPTYRAAAAAAAAAAQAQIAAVAAAAASNTSSSPGSSAFSQPLPKNTAVSGNRFTNATNISRSLSNLANPTNETPSPYIPSQTAPFQMSFDSSLIQNSFNDSRQSETATASSLFTPYHPYHLAAAAAFASSQMVELQRSFALSHSSNSMDRIPASQDEDMPSSTTQEHSPIVNDESSSKSRGEEAPQSRSSATEKFSASSSVKKRNSKNPYSIDEILREEEGPSSIETSRPNVLKPSTCTSYTSTAHGTEDPAEQCDYMGEEKFVSKNIVPQKSLKVGMLLTRNYITERSDSVKNKKLKYSEDVEEWEDSCVLKEKVEEERDMSLYHSERQLSSFENICENNSLLSQNNSPSIGSSKKTTDLLVVEGQDVPNSK